jgi:hypothetical protein
MRKRFKDDEGGCDRKRFRQYRRIAAGEVAGEIVKVPENASVRLLIYLGVFSFFLLLKLNHHRQDAI